MAKQYCMEWQTKSGRTGWKSIGKDCPAEAEKALKKKIKTKSCLSAYITYNFVGDDSTDQNFGKDYFYKGLYKGSEQLDVFGTTVNIFYEDDIREMETRQDTLLG